MYVTAAFFRQRLVSRLQGTFSLLQLTRPDYNQRQHKQAALPVQNRKDAGGFTGFSRKRAVDLFLHNFCAPLHTKSLLSRYNVPNSPTPH